MGKPLALDYRHEKAKEGEERKQKDWGKHGVKGLACGGEGRGLHIPKPLEPAFLVGPQTATLKNVSVTKTGWEGQASGFPVGRRQALGVATLCATLLANNSVNHGA